MDFDRIWIKEGKQVELDYTVTKPTGATVGAKEKDKQPTIALKAALAAFSNYVVWVISGPSSWENEITIRGVAIKRHDDQPRGIVVTAIRKCSRARNGTVAINTPYLTERPEASGPTTTTGGGGFLPDYVPDLIDALEEAAEAYFNGERGEQVEMGLTQNAADVDKKMREASMDSTKKPRTKKSKDAAPGTGDVVNPDVVELTDDLMRQLLLMVERDVSIDRIGEWTATERQSAQRWAVIRQKELAGQLGDLATVPTEPACIIRDGTTTLADAWTEPPPRKQPPEAMEKAKEQIKAAVESGT